MQTLKTLFLPLVVLVSTAVAAKEENNKLLSIVIAHKYSTQKTEIYKEKNELYCHTEINPRFYIDEKTKESDIKAQIEEVKMESLRSSTNEKCNDLASPFMLTYGKNVVKGCTDSPSAKKLVLRLSKICGRY